MDLPSENRDLFKRIANEDDERAFTIFFERYHIKLIQFALMFIPHLDQAEDIVSNVMVRLIKNAHKVFNLENLEGYLFMAVKNEAINFIKKEDKYRLVISDNEKVFFLNDFIDPMEKLIEKELREMISNTVENFPPKRKMVYKMIKDDGMKYQEVANLLEISKRTVEVHLKLAIKELRVTVRRYLSASSGNSGYMNIVKAFFSIIMTG